MMQPINFKTSPSMLVFEISMRNIKVSKTLKFEQEGRMVVLDVRRLIYHGDFNFTSCIIGTDGIVWYHDGMTTWSNLGEWAIASHGMYESTLVFISALEYNDLHIVG